MFRNSETVTFHDLYTNKRFVSVTNRIYINRINQKHLSICINGNIVDLDITRMKNIRKILEFRVRISRVIIK